MEIPLGGGQIMLAPKIEAKMLQELGIKKTDKVLEIGTGSGYMAALLAARAEHVSPSKFARKLPKSPRKTLSAPAFPTSRRTWRWRQGLGATRPLRRHCRFRLLPAVPACSSSCVSAAHGRCGWRSAGHGSPVDYLHGRGHLQHRQPLETVIPALDGVEVKGSFTF
jgi:protein-L-isoaspartate(D-aspartate) O-methyltransferase